MTPYEIPLLAAAQTLLISLGGTQYTLNVWWSVLANAWNVDILAADGVTPIVTSIPLVTGTDLLAQYGYLNFGGQLIAQTDFKVSAPPTYANLGTTGHLYFVTTP